MPKLLKDDRVQAAFLIAERYADGLASEGGREIAYQQAALAQPCPAVLLPVAVYQSADDVERVADNLLDGGSSLSDQEELAAQTVLLRDIFGNPFRPSPPLSASVLSWNDGTVFRIAEGIYIERAFDRMPILHDALVDAGCTDEALLSHCRNPEGHVLGYWAVDLILRKE
jgi:hypothetical protein